MISGISQYVLCSECVSIKRVGYSVWTRASKVIFLCIYFVIKELPVKASFASRGKNSCGNMHCCSRKSNWFRYDSDLSLALNSWCSFIQIEWTHNKQSRMLGEWCDLHMHIKSNPNADNSKWIGRSGEGFFFPRRNGCCCWSRCSCRSPSLRDIWYVAVA